MIAGYSKSPIEALHSRAHMSHSVDHFVPSIWILLHCLLLRDHDWLVLRESRTSFRFQTLKVSSKLSGLLSEITCPLQPFWKEWKIIDLTQVQVLHFKGDRVMCQPGIFRIARSSCSLKSRALHHLSHDPVTWPLCLDSAQKYQELLPWARKVQSYWPQDGAHIMSQVSEWVIVDDILKGFLAACDECG